MEKFNLVFLPDSNYSDVIINKFEVLAPNVNVYLCLCNAPKYLKRKDVIFIKANFFGIFKGDFSFLNRRYAKIYFNLNSLVTSNFYYKYIHHHPNFFDARLLLMFWSGELYNHPAYKETIYDSHSSKYTKSYKQFFSSKLVDAGLNIFKMPSYSKYYQLNQKMDYFCGFFESEHQLYNDVFNAKSKFILFTFLDLILLKLPENTAGSEQENILIGNSGSIENNHHEIFEILRGTDQQGYKKMLVPLSYGHMDYIQSMIAFGKKYFGEKFVPMTAFLQREEYNHQVSNVKVAIFNHYVQQAIGNIFFMLYIGARVYFNEKNPLYKGFLAKGFIVNSLEAFEEIGLKPLLITEAVHNKNLIIKLMNVEASLKYYKAILEI